VSIDHGTTLILRTGRPGEVARAAALLGRWPVVPANGRLLVLADVAADDGAMVRATAVVRPTEDIWVVDVAAIDERWPPVAAALVSQLCAAAAAAGAVRLSVAPAAMRPLADALLMRSSATICAGGWVLVDV
jgi:hypothetical protein